MTERRAVASTAAAVAPGGSGARPRTFDPPARLTVVNGYRLVLVGVAGLAGAGFAVLLAAGLGVVSRTTALVATLALAALAAVATVPVALVWLRVRRRQGE